MNDTDVIICAYTMRRWDRLQLSVRSAIEQNGVNKVLLVIDHNDELLSAANRLYANEPQVHVLPNTATQGLSGARNTGVAASTAELVAFLDDDAVAAPNWLGALREVLREEHATVTGGRAEPEWIGGKAGKWLPDETLWVVGCSFTGQATQVTRVRNVMGCSMLFKREAIVSAGNFNEATGRVGTLPIGAEETELCIRISQQNPSAKVMFVPQSIVHHEVSPDRLTYKYLVRRGWYEGISKAYITAKLPKNVLGTESGYAVMLVGRTFAYLLRGKLRSAIALPSLLVATVGGYGYGMLKLRRATGRAALAEAAA
jgi:GT2 family glycosyltransferase